jgi:hypothetical protein
VLIAELEAVDSVTQNFTGIYTVDIQDDDGDNLLPIASFSDVESAGELTGTGEANLAFDAAFFQDFFNLGLSDIFNLAVDGTAQINYNLAAADTDVFNAFGDEQILSFGDDPVIAYQNLGLDLGTFFNDFIKPIVEGVQDVLGPIEPVISFLNDDLPLLDDLGMADDGGDPYTPLTLAAQVAATAGEEQLAADLTTVAEIVNILDIILDFDLSQQENSAGTLPLGSFTASANRSLSGPIVGLQAFITSDQANDDAREQAEGNGTALSDFLDALGSKFEFPLLEDPTNFFSLLVGDPSPELFTLALDFEFEFPVRCEQRLRKQIGYHSNPFIYGGLTVSTCGQHVACLGLGLS